jgi:hypothetical protein
LEKEESKKRKKRVNIAGIKQAVLQRKEERGREEEREIT